MQTKKSKTILKTVGQWDTKAVIVTQVRPTNSAINYQKRKKKKIKTMKIYQFLLSSRGCLYRTKDYILVFLIKKKSAQKYHSVRGAFSCKRTIKWLCLGVQKTRIQVVYRVFFNHSCHLYFNYKETKIFHKNPFNKSTKAREKIVTTLGKNWRTKLLFTMTSETNKHLSL